MEKEKELKEEKENTELVKKTVSASSNKNSKKAAEDFEKQLNELKGRYDS